MEIEYCYKRKYIKIFRSPTIPTKIKYDLVKELNLFFELKNLDNTILNESSLINEITGQEIHSYLECYNESNLGFPFEVFLDLVSFTSSDLKICLRGSNHSIAVIDFQPDGNIDTIWIDILDSSHLKELVRIIKKVCI